MEFAPDNIASFKCSADPTGANNSGNFIVFPLNKYD
jgi:hypothetical protein